MTHPVQPDLRTAAAVGADAIDFDAIPTLLIFADENAGVEAVIGKLRRNSRLIRAALATQPSATEPAGLRLDRMVGGRSGRVVQANGATPETVGTITSPRSVAQMADAGTDALIHMAEMVRARDEREKEMDMLTRDQEIEIIARGLRDRQPDETDEELVGRIIDDFAHSQPKYLHSGREHNTDDGLNCWCEPYRDSVEPNLIIHRKAGEA